MVNRILCLILFLILPLFLFFSEEIPESEFIFRYSKDNKPEFIQKIYWASSPYASKYNFFLKDTNDKIVIQKETEENYLECSLQAGDYFYKIITYNILGQAENETPWEKITIEQAFLPIVESMSIEKLYVEKYYGDPIIIKGKDFTKKVKVQLKDITNITRPIIDGTIVSVENTKIVVQFKLDDLILGKYEMIITNPGNVYAKRPFEVKYKKPVDFLITGGYSPLINSYMGDFNKELVNVFYPGGFQIDFVTFVYKSKYGFFGVGSSFDFTYFHDTKEVSLYLIILKNSFSFNYLYQFNKYIGILPKIGFGISVTGLLFDYGSRELNRNMISADPFITTGVAAQIRPWRSITILTGFDYSQIIYKDSTFGFFKPYVSFGYHF